MQLDALHAHQTGRVEALLLLCSCENKVVENNKTLSSCTYSTSICNLQPLLGSECAAAPLRQRSQCSTRQCSLLQALLPMLSEAMCGITHREPVQDSAWMSCIHAIITCNCEADSASVDDQARGIISRCTPPSNCIVKRVTMPSMRSAGVLADILLWSSFTCIWPISTATASRNSICKRARAPFMAAARVKDPAQVATAYRRLQVQANICAWC